MPLFYQMRRGVLQESRQFSKRPPMDMRVVKQFERRAERFVKHPTRNGLRQIAVFQTTMDNRLPELSDLAHRDQLLIVPRMPRIGDLQISGNMGVVLWCISTSSEITRASAIG
jgi:hypothetical protein